MPSVADICNLALSHLGSDTVVTSISPPDGSVDAGHCARFYPIARKEALEHHTWTWSKKRVALAAVTNPSTMWTYAYAVPSDCISAKRVLQQQSVQQFITFDSPFILTADAYQLFTERGSSEFEIEDGVLLTHEPEAVLLYVRDVVDTTKFSTSFVSALSYLLASYLAGPIIKGDVGAQTSARLRQAAMNLMSEAGSDDANDSSETNEHVPTFIAGRWS